MTQATCTTPTTAETRTLSKFEQLFRLWMAGFGVTEAQADTICTDRRIAMSIRLNDSGGLAQDLSGALRSLPHDAELRKVADSAQGRLELMMLLK